MAGLEEPTSAAPQQPKHGPRGADAAPAGADACSEARPRPLRSVRLVPHLDPLASDHFRFEPHIVMWDESDPSTEPIVVCRWSERHERRASLGATRQFSFKSKVVSRAHAQIAFNGTHWTLQDIGSTSGTFLNNARLGEPNKKSKTADLMDGDIIQFGVDYRGGEQPQFKAVRCRVELDTTWKATSKYMQDAQRNLLALGVEDPVRQAISECCICLYEIRAGQSLFVAPCSHVYHYKCIRPLLENNHPSFLCCVCRKYAYLEDSVEVERDAERFYASGADNPLTPVAEEFKEVQWLPNMSTVLNSGGEDTASSVTSAFKAISLAKDPDTQPPMLGFSRLRAAWGLDTRTTNAPSGSEGLALSSDARVACISE